MRSWKRLRNATKNVRTPFASSSLDISSKSANYFTNLHENRSKGYVSFLLLPMHSPFHSYSIDTRFLRQLNSSLIRFAIENYFYRLRLKNKKVKFHVNLSREKISYFEFWILQNYSTKLKKRDCSLLWSKTQYGNCWIEIYYPFLSSNLYQYPWNIPQDEKYNELDKTNFNQFDFSNYRNNCILIFDRSSEIDISASFRNRLIGALGREDDRTKDAKLLSSSRRIGKESRPGRGEEGKIWNSEAAERGDIPGLLSRETRLVSRRPPPLYKSVNCLETNLGKYNRYVLTRAPPPPLIRRSAVSPRSIRPGLLYRSRQPTLESGTLFEIFQDDFDGCSEHCIKRNIARFLSA